jgi:hypothetical protein
MSHQHGLAKGYISNVEPTTFTSTGSNQPLTITTDNNVSQYTKVTIPSSLGTLESSEVIRLNATTSRIDCKLNITSIPASGTTTHKISVDTGGVEATGSVELFNIAKTAFTPAALMENASDTWFQATDASSVGDGNLVSSVTPGHGNRGALTQGSSTYQPTYNASVAELNGKPAITINSNSNEWLNGLLPNSNYIFKVSETAFTLAVVWAPVSGTTDRRFFMKNEGYGSSISMDWDEDNNQLIGFYLGGDNMGNINYSNDDTTAPRRMILTCTGTVANMTEPTTGINSDETAGTGNVNSNTSRTWLGGTNVHIAEMILVTGRELSTAEKEKLNSYWIARYGS